MMVVSSPVEMANLALAHLREPKINSFSGAGIAAQWFSVWYDPARQAVLARHRWNFAVERVKVSASSTPPPFGWTYAFDLPNDCLRLHPVTYEGVENAPRVKHAVEGRQILTNDKGPLCLKYVRDVTEEGLFDALFVETFSHYLAAGLAHSVTGKRSMAVEQQQLFESALATAQRVDAMQGTPEEPIASDYVLARSQGWPC